MLYPARAEGLVNMDNIVASMFFACGPSWIRRIVKFFNVVNRFHRKPFWLFLFSQFSVLWGGIIKHWRSWPLGMWRLWLGSPWLFRFHLSWGKGGCIPFSIRLLCSGYINHWECPRGVKFKAMDCRIVASEFVFQSRYCVHFRANTLGKGMNPLILSAID